jgi:ribosomal protein S7
MGKPQMSKNKSFTEELKNLKTSNTYVQEIKIDKIMNALIKNGQKEDAENIKKAAADEDLPMFTLYRALNNVGHEISYTAVRTARRKYSKTGV